jgi:hypothetical protein
MVYRLWIKSACRTGPNGVESDVMDAVGRKTRPS